MRAHNNSSHDHICEISTATDPLEYDFSVGSTLCTGRVKKIESDTPWMDNDRQIKLNTPFRK